MARRINWVFNEASIPDYVTVDGKKVEITGVFTSYRPRAMFCKCGYMTNCKDRGESNPTFEGYVCPECGRKHAENSVLNQFGWVGSEMSYYEYSYDGKKINQKTVAYKLASPGENMLSLTKKEENEMFTLEEIGRDRKHGVPKYFKDVLRTEYVDQIHPMMKLLLDAEIDKGFSYGTDYYNRLDIVEDVYNANPQLFTTVLAAMRVAPVSYETFEMMYPEYLLPLSEKLIRDYNPVEDRNRSYSQPMKWHSIGEYSNIEAVTCVVSYYKSGLIAFRQMKNLLDKVNALKNPCFVRAFKANYLQMENYIEDLEAEGVNVSKVLFDVKDYYNTKSRKFFIEYGLTPAQVNDAFASSKDGLDLLITLGSTRRKKTAKP